MNEEIRLQYERLKDQFVMPRKSAQEVLEHFSALLDFVEAEDSFFKTLHLGICTKNVQHQTQVMEALQAVGKEPLLTMLRVVDNEKSKNYYHEYCGDRECGIYLVVEQHTGFVVDTNCNELSRDLVLYGGISQQDLEGETLYFLHYLAVLQTRYME